MAKNYKQFLAKSKIRRATVMSLKHAGFSATEIGRQLKMSRQRAEQIIKAETAKLEEVK